jgi:hypothetical protein
MAIATVAALVQQAAGDSLDITDSSSPTRTERPNGFARLIDSVAFSPGTN